MEETPESNNSTKKKTFLIINCIILSIGCIGGPMVSRLYFLGGGKRVWFSSWLETGGWPMNFLPLIVTYFQRRKAQGGPNAKLILITPDIFAKSAIIGVLTGLVDYVYAYGVSLLPISTVALLIATQLAFTAFFARLLVKQKFTAASINAIVLLTMGAGCLAIGASNDRPAGESNKDYVLGFFMTLMAACIYGFVLPGIEHTHNNVKQPMTYTLVLEMQLIICFFATAFCTIGMIINKDFQALPREARAFTMGADKYIAVLFANAILWQFFFMGVVGVSCYGNSLLSGIIISVMIPVVEVLGVIFYGESFRAEKAISLVLSLWGFVSYFYGEIQTSKKSKSHDAETIDSQPLPV